MKRRDFLGRVAQAIAALGLTDAGWLRLGDRYYQALAQPTRRKLALLVGINQYPYIEPLSGCLTDVELQRELLIHRFGFQGTDILTLTEQQATRQQIETAFLEHLTKQAQPGDVVVFHFSGYGRRVQREHPASSTQQEEKNYLPLTYNSLVPVDGVLPASEVPVVNDLLDETLWLLMRSLPTKNITTVLDTSFNAPATILPGNLQVRSFPQAAQGQISAAELAFQQLQQNSKLAALSMPGVVLVAADSTQSAIEARWNGFSAGLFTYALTQYLWEVSRATTVQVSLSRVTGVVEQLVGKEQQPKPNGQKNQEQFQLAYHLSPNPSVGAGGVVKFVEQDGKTAQLWLAGIPPTVLKYYEIGSKLVVTPQETETSRQADKEDKGAERATSYQPLATSLLQVRSRTGLIAKAHLVSENSNNSLQVGQLVQESVRVLPRNIRLIIALAPSLERIERVDATSAFAAIPYVSLVTAGEQLADYVFGRVSQEKPLETPTSLLSASPPSRYALFSLAQKLIPNTAGELGEAVKVAVQRLAPKLQTLLAAKLWRLTTNEGSSLLNVKATLEVINTPQRVLIQRETLRSLQAAPIASLFSERAKLYAKAPRQASASDSENNIPTLPIGSRIQYQVHNGSDRPVYLLLLGLDSSKNAIALYSTQPTPNANGSNTKPLLLDVAIAPRETLILPQTAVDFEWVIHKPPGLAEHQLIFSSAKFSRTLAAMAAATQDIAEQQYIGSLSNPLEVAQAMMQDLHNASATVAQQTTRSNTTEAVSPTADTYSLDVNHWASLSFVYQVT